MGFVFYLLIATFCPPAQGATDAEARAQEFVKWIKIGQQSSSPTETTVESCEASPSPFFIYPQGNNRSEIQLCFAGKSHLLANEISWFDIQKAANENYFPLKILLPELERKSSSSSWDLCERSDRSFLSLKKSWTAIAPLVGAQPSITENKELLINLWYHSGRDRGFTTPDQLIEAVKRGERLVIEIKKCALTECSGNLPIPFCKPCPKNPPEDRESREKALVDLMWYLQAEAGKKMVLNPQSWSLEPGFVEAGTYRFKDEGNALLNYLNLHQEAYSRWSSHYKEESKAGQKGLNMDASLGTLPGHKGTKTLLFGELANQQIFLKIETQGLKASEPIAAIKHMLNYIKKRFASKEPLNNYHSEAMPPDLKKLILNYCKSTQKCSGDKLAKAGIEKALTTIQDLEKESGDHPLVNTLQTYAREMCGKSAFEASFFIKGCEAALELPSAPRPAL